MKKWSLILFFAVLIGMYFGLGNIFNFFKLLFLFGICSLLLLVLIFIWKKPNQKLNYAIGVYITLIFGLIFSLAFAGIKKEYNQRQGEITADRILEFKRNHNRFPNSLSELGNEKELPKYFDQFELKEFEYSVNQSRNEFNLNYSLDGWHINELNSKNGEWQSRD